jgi:hypothetical protein
VNNIIRKYCVNEQFLLAKVSVRSGKNPFYWRLISISGTTNNNEARTAMFGPKAAGCEVWF